MYLSAKFLFNNLANSRYLASNNTNNNNNNSTYENSDLFHYHYPAPNPISNAEDKPADKVQDRKRKYDELRTFVTRYYTTEGAEKALEIARWYLSHGDDRFIDEQLAMFRKPDGRL